MWKKGVRVLTKDHEMLDQTFVPTAVTDLMKCTCPKFAKELAPVAKEILLQCLKSRMETTKSKFRQIITEWSKWRELFATQSLQTF